MNTKIQLSRPAIIISIILFVGFLVRLIGLEGLSFWVDEYVHIQCARAYLEGTGPLVTDDNNGILLTVFILPFFKFLGMNEWTARIPSVLFGTTAIYLSFRIAKKLFNAETAILSTLLTASSLYLIYWSRLARNYSIFECFYLLLLLIFIYIFLENKFSPKSIGLLLFTAFLSFLSHQLSFFFFISAAFYFILINIPIFRTGDESKKTIQIQQFLGILSTFALSAMFIPFFGNLLKTALGVFLPDRIVNWVIPNWDRISQLLSEKPFEAFQVYTDVLTYDYGYLWIFGVAGLIVAAIKNRRSGLFICSFFLLPYLLMSFIFREPSLPRYLIYIYPLFLMLVAYGIWEIWYLISQKWLRSTKFNLAICLIPIIPFIRFSEIKSLVLVEQKEGLVVDSRLAKWAFVNWKDPARYLKPQIKEGDIILSTVPKAASWYLDLPEDEIIWFRQRIYDTEQNGYVPYTDLPEEPHAFTSEGFQHILQSNPRGWFLADYYLDNILTDPGTKSIAYTNLHFNKDASPDGSVRLFSWNHANGWEQNQQMVVVLGKTSSKLYSKEMKLNIPPEFLKKPQLEFFFYTEGIDSSKEAY
ncbi:MAG: glycosyltransferase family 39 protein, partial [Saprospiraceae bacterium]|nr:glycosyltransferase family 39 protein [Saprospiraceae bacterium]